MPRHLLPQAYTCEPLLQSPMISVELCDSNHRQRKHIVNIPFHLIARHAPKWFPMMVPNARHGTPYLTIPILTLSHAADIEIPALTLLFTSWLSSNPFPTTSIADCALMHRALQLAQRPRTDHVRQMILCRLRAEPVTETDVQTLWWSFQHTDVFIEMLNALLCNIVRFSVLEKEPSGGLVLHFVENELLQLHERAQERVAAIYVKHREAFAVTSLIQRIWKTWNGVFGGGSLGKKRVPSLMG